jgi:hypothetical protein
LEEQVLILLPTLAATDYKRATGSAPNAQQVGLPEVVLHVLGKKTSKRIGALMDRHYGDGPTSLEDQFQEGLW